MTNVPETAAQRAACVAEMVMWEMKEIRLRVEGAASIIRSAQVDLQAAVDFYKEALSSPGNAKVEVSHEIKATGCPRIDADGGT